VKALVTGGGGFIGSNVVDGLLLQEHSVAVLDNFATGRRVNLEGALERGVALYEVDLVDAGAVHEVMAVERPEVVFHLAAQIDVRRSVEDPAFDARVNLEGTLNLLEAARRAEVRRLVYTSTGGALYGEADEVPTSEDAPIRPLAPYGHSKFAGEGAALLYQRLHGLSVISLRYANVYGPRQDPLGEAGVIAIFCGKALYGGRPTVYGDGRQTRDFLYVGDVVEANLAAADSDVVGAFNVGTGTETTVLDLLEALRRLVPEAELEPEFAPERSGEVRRSCLAADRVREALGWQARTPLSEGLRVTLAAAEASPAAGPSVRASTGEDG
jgi:UDP-glucose 4-epimerase